MYQKMVTRIKGKSWEYIFSILIISFGVLGGVLGIQILRLASTVTTVRDIITFAALGYLVLAVGVILIIEGMRK